MEYSIKPGKTWLDTEGNRIQAHAGYMMYIDNTFYWYGENKERSQSEYEIWHWGVRLYSSQDLYNWKSEGIIVPPQPADPANPFHPKSKMDRPHIIYNEKTKKFVMWVKVMGTADSQHMVISTADRIQGPYTIVCDRLNPLGMNSGDFDLVKREDGSAMIVFEQVHSNMIVADLTEDYLNVTGKYSVHYERSVPPYVREAPAVFFRHGRGYIITSGTTAKFPNPSETACFDDLHGEWTILGDPHVNDPKKTSFDSQISCIFKHPHYEDLYIAMADRWLTDLPEDAPSGVEFFAARTDSSYPMTEEYRSYVKSLKLEDLTKKNTALAEYVWLPIRFEQGIPKIYWHDQWRVEDIARQISEERG